MTYMGNLTKGDRVRVTIEAEVKYGSSFAVDLKVGNGTVTIREESFSGVTHEKIEPPVVVFKRGDTVRHKHSGGVYSIGHGGYYSHQLHEFSEESSSYLTDEFTSAQYEKIDLSAVPR